MSYDQSELLAQDEAPSQLLSGGGATASTKRARDHGRTVEGTISDGVALDSPAKRFRLAGQLSETSLFSTKVEEIHGTISDPVTTETDSKTSWDVVGGVRTLYSLVRTNDCKAFMRLCEQTMPKDVKCYLSNLVSKSTVFDDLPLEIAAIVWEPMLETTELFSLILVSQLWRMRVTSLVTEIPWTCFLRRSMRFVLSFPFVQHIDLPMYVRSYGASEFKYLWELKSLQSLSCFEVVPNDTLEVLRQGLTGLCELDLRANRAHLRKLTLKFHLQNMRDSELFEFFSSLPNLEILEICSLSIECGQKKRFFLSSKLHSLRFENCPTLTNGWLLRLKALSTLGTLTLVACPQVEFTPLMCAALVNLSCLRFSPCSDVFATFCSAVQSLPNLKTLALECGRLFHNTHASLLRIPLLEKLYLHEIHDEIDFRSLFAALPRLIEFRSSPGFDIPTGRRVIKDEQKKILNVAFPRVAIGAEPPIHRFQRHPYPCEDENLKWYSRRND